MVDPNATSTNDNNNNGNDKDKNKDENKNNVVTTNDDNNNNDNVITTINNNNNHNEGRDVHENEDHARIGTYFLGPRAENAGLLRELIDKVLLDQALARESLFSEDPSFVSESMTASSAFSKGAEELRGYVAELSEKLALHSVPFWSPRYNGHMCMDVALPSIIGYMAAMLYNPNNVSTEASPVTTDMERVVGEDLCNLLGFGKEHGITPWGHITCDGSVANLEAIWAARNLKFYPLSLKLAMAEGAPLEFLNDVRPPFVVTTCRGKRKPFTKLTTWELLNLKPGTVLELPTRLQKEYSIAAPMLQDALGPYLIQSVGKDYLERHFEIQQSGRLFVSATNHYSWPKGGAITGIGSNNIISVKVDNEARMDIDDLRAHLYECVKKHIPVYSCVAIIGSTEHGSCDPLSELVLLRHEFEAKGLSFAIHADAAWGGYFASFLHTSQRGPDGHLPLHPLLTLNSFTMHQLESLKYADSVTIDPHKSGYINYPAGGLCYRDQRTRYLITWTSPIVYHEADVDESMGVYGVEGSKPGAAAAAAWLTHKMISLTPQGYGMLLGEALFSSTKLYCHWATMTGPEDDLIVCPLIRLPSEMAGDPKEGVELEKQRIREKILGVPNSEIFADDESFLFLDDLGGDLMINAFACNFRVNGKINNDVNEANNLNERIFQRLSVSTTKDIVAERPLFLTSSSFGEKAYGTCLETYKKRLHLVHNGKPARGDMTFLVNVTMSPWPVEVDFLQTLADQFKAIANEEMAKSVMRNTIEPTFHTFVMQGLEEIYLVYHPMFNMASHRCQLIIKAELPMDVKKRYQQLRKENPTRPYTIANQKKALLEDLIKPSGSDEEWLLVEDPNSHTFKLSNIHVVVHESLFFNDLEDKYPQRMPFYLYGSTAEAHIDHVLKKAPNGMISSDLVELDLTPDLSDEELVKGVVAVFDDVFEASIQPLPRDDKMNIRLYAPGLNLGHGRKHKASIFKSFKDAMNNAKPIARGSVRMGDCVCSDWKGINMDPAVPNVKEN